MLMHLIGYFYETNHDAHSSEHKVHKPPLLIRRAEVRNILRTSYLQMYT